MADWFSPAIFFLNPQLPQKCFIDLLQDSVSDGKSLFKKSLLIRKATVRFRHDRHYFSFDTQTQYSRFYL